MRIIAIGFTCLVFSSAFGQVVVPNILENTHGNTFTYLLHDDSFNLTTRAYDLEISESQLTGLIGKEISSFQLRPVTGNSTIIVPDYRVSLQGTIVRSGPLTIQSASFVSGTWAPAVEFDHPYFYSGGDLHFQILTTRISPTSNFPLYDSLIGANLGAVASITNVVNGPFGPIVTTFNNMSLMAVKFNPVPEPASLAVLGLGALALIKRRKGRSSVL